jgi:membrane protease YdiL (CAAX protease family)
VEPLDFAFGRRQRADSAGDCESVLRAGLRSYRFHKYLPDQKLAAWHLGWKWAPFKKFALQSLAMFAVMLPILWFASREPGTRTFYLSYFPLVLSGRDWAWLLASLVLYMACWEWFFRGWLLFSLAQGFGAPIAIVLQAVVFGLAHGNKPPLEMASSFVGGLILGIVAWREKSFVPAFLTHALVHVAWAIMILKS